MHYVSCGGVCLPPLSFSPHFLFTVCCIAGVQHTSSLTDSLFLSPRRYGVVSATDWMTLPTCLSPTFCLPRYRDNPCWAHQWDPVLFCALTSHSLFCTCTHSVFGCFALLAPFLPLFPSPLIFSFPFVFLLFLSSLSLPRSFPLSWKSPTSRITTLGREAKMSWLSRITPRGPDGRNSRNVAPSSPCTADPETCLMVFENHWRQVMHAHTTSVSNHSFCFYLAYGEQNKDSLTWGLCECKSHKSCCKS